MSANDIDVATFDPIRYYRLPADPWHIVCRWKKEGKPTESIHGGQTPYPARFLAANPMLDLRKSAVSTGAASSDTASEKNTHVYSVLDNRKQDFVYMRMEIQIYEMEYGVYLVDFKCTGYERQDGSMLEEKDVMSPFPFLDMAARLIMQLAEAD